MSILACIFLKKIKTKRDNTLKNETIYNKKLNVQDLLNYLIFN